MTVTSCTIEQLPDLPRRVKGRVSEIAFSLEATSRGWDVCTPLAGTDDYDCIVKRYNTRPIVVQVKRATLLQSETWRMFKVTGCPASRPYSEMAYDVLAAHLAEVDKWVFFTRQEMGDRTKTTYTLPEDRKLSTKSSALAPRDPDNWDLLHDVAESLTLSGSTPTNVLPPSAY